MLLEDNLLNANLNFKNLIFWMFYLNKFIHQETKAMPNAYFSLKFRKCGSLWKPKQKTLTSSVLNTAQLQHFWRNSRVLRFNKDFMTKTMFTLNSILPQPNSYLQ